MGLDLTRESKSIRARLISPISASLLICTLSREVKYPFGSTDVASPEAVEVPETYKDYEFLGYQNTGPGTHLIKFERQHFVTSLTHLHEISESSALGRSFKATALYDILVLIICA